MKLRYLITVLFVMFSRILPVEAAGWEYPKVLFIGDSYALTSDWPNQTAYLAGIEEYSIGALGGTGFAAVVPDNGKDTDFIVLLEDACAQMSNSAYVEWIIVEGGFNDQMYTEEEILAGMQRFAEKAKELCPYAKMAVGMNGWHASDSGSVHVLRSVAETYRKGAGENGMMFINDLTGCLNGQGNVFMDDGIHPTPDGGAVIAHITADWYAEASAQQAAFEKSENFKGLAVNLAVLGSIFAGSYTVLARKKKKLSIGK